MPGGDGLLWRKQAATTRSTSPQAIPVTVTKVTTSHAVFYDEYPGTVTALNQVELRAQVNGYITGIYFEDGARVKKGQRLYSIDQQAYEATYQQAVASLAVQEANLVKAQKMLTVFMNWINRMPLRSNRWTMPMLPWKLPKAGRCGEGQYTGCTNQCTLHHYSGAL
ncbi:efflux RND transporter periplasmic adaptor subunit [Paraflavitalea speifideaquila]|uniref:efflux RND transporter periplasmic adaptor subunit n=1 Tax=Paraflavitalea speifideaquila TaxID=3076558 RepID=UPI0028EA4CFD|nr:biotin/lipoyl-binding protein [Paraflavitalea speifideiaquila]